jgi:hypothetical protein
MKCSICDEHTDMEATRRCNGCWEVETRLSSYLKYPKGFNYAYHLMLEQHPSIRTVLGEHWLRSQVTINPLGDVVWRLISGLPTETLYCDFVPRPDATSEELILEYFTPVIVYFKRERAKK